MDNIGLDFSLDLNSKENLFLFSPKIDVSKKERLIGHLRQLGLDSHIFILSSGTTSDANTLKGYALSKSAVAANAAAVNRLLGLGPDDAWTLSLPPWHVGGLSVFARAKLAGAKVHRNNSKWDPLAWAASLEKSAVTSIVPLQAYDLVDQKVKAPKSLKHLIVGGDYLSQELHSRLGQLGWPVRRTFGMTEVCSQLATEKQFCKEPGPEVLGIHKVRISAEGVVEVKSPALFTGRFVMTANFRYDACPVDDEGFFKTSDLAKIEEGRLTHLGRVDEAFKSKGRLFYFNDLRERLASFAVQEGLYGKLELGLVEDKREGKMARISALRELEARKQELEERLRQVFAPLSIFEILFVESFSRTELGKLKR